jgi:hypothetical protein
MRNGAGVRPGYSASTWQLSRRAQVPTGIVTSSSLTEPGHSECNQARTVADRFECTQRMVHTQTPHPTTGTFRTNDDGAGEGKSMLLGSALRSPYGQTLPPSGIGHNGPESDMAIRRAAFSVQHGVGATPARLLLDRQPQFALGSTTTFDATSEQLRAARALSMNETLAVERAFGQFDLNLDGEIDVTELTCVSKRPACLPSCSEL